mgnify:CR=1 FL=1
MVLGPDGYKKRHTFHRVMMRSRAKLAYAQAQAAIDGQTDETTAPLLEPVLKPLWAAYFCSRKARDIRGPLDLDLRNARVAEVLLDEVSDLDVLNEEVPELVLSCVPARAPVLCRDQRR